MRREKEDIEIDREKEISIEIDRQRMNTFNSNFNKIDLQICTALHSTYIYIYISKVQSGAFSLAHKVFFLVNDITIVQSANWSWFCHLRWLIRIRCALMK